MKAYTILKRYIHEPRKIFIALGRRGLLKWMPDIMYLTLVYQGEMGKKLNVRKPETFNEKLQWIKLYDRKPEYITYADKYAVREHIKNTIGEEFLIPLIDVYNSVDEINWDKLPNKFVLKCTHGSGCNIICTDKDALDIEAAKRKLRKWMKYNYFWPGREWPYKDIKPRITCEIFISETDNTPDDYKVLCFNGKAKLVEVHIDRYGNHMQDFYDLQWHKTNISQDDTTSHQIYKKPKQFEKMIALSEQLSSDIPHVRIDWFIVKDKLYFGEITFFDGNGFATFDDEKDDYLLGSWIMLPNTTND